MNLAGVLPWIHWRGFVVLGLLAVGQRVVHGLPVPGAPDPRPPLAPGAASAGRDGSGASGWRVALVALFFWSYEAFSLWDRPRWTAWIVVGYFVGGLRRSTASSAARRSASTSAPSASSTSSSRWSRRWR